MERIILHQYICLLAFLLLYACHQAPEGKILYNGPADIEQEKAFLMQISHPAGMSSAHAFLPYPANYGYFTENENIAVLALTNHLAKGTQVAVSPVATLVLKEANQERPIIIATPIDSALQITTVVDYKNFLIQEAGARQIIQDWFLYEKGLGVVDLVDWKDEQYAWKLLKRDLD